MSEEELPSKDSELNADFLIQFVKIDKRDAEEVAKILSDKKVRVVQTLLTWETKDVLFHDLFGDLSNANTFKGIAGLLWEFILKYHPERANIPIPISSKKRLTKVGPGNSTGLTLFVHNEYKREKRLKLDDYRSGSIYALSRHLFGDLHTPFKVYIRECYKTLGPKIHELIKTNNVLIAGTRGIGKSTLGFLMVFDFADKGDIVLYHHKKEQVLIIGPDVDKDKFSSLNFILQANDYEPIVEKDVYFFRAADVDLFTLLSKHEDFRFVQDLGDDRDAYPPRSGEGRKLILSSPNNEALRQLHNASYRRLYMPLWTLEELLEAQPLCFPDLTSEHVTKQFEIYGGVPRLVLEMDPKSAEVLLREQLDRMDVNVLFNIMAKKTYTELPTSRSTYILIHVVPDTDFEFKCVFATPIIARKLVEQFLDDANFSMQTFITNAKSISEMAAWRGNMLEALAHRVFVRGAQKVKLVQLYEKAKPKSLEKTHEGVEIKFSKREYFFDVETLIEIHENVYYIPQKKNEPTIDSFAVVHRSFVEKYFPLEAKLHPQALFFILFFQVTVSNKHVVDGNQIRKVQKIAKEKINQEDLPVIFLFVTEPGGITKRQEVTHLVADEERKAAVKADVTASGASPKRVAQKREAYRDQKKFGNQYACHIGARFAELKDLWRES